MKAYTLLFLFFSQVLFAQSERKKFLPTQVAGLQFAGSIGWLSAGYFRQAANEKIEVGLTYGYTPLFAGGRIHTVALKFIYEPFRINVKPVFQIEPLQVGVFIAQNFGNNLYYKWPDNYPRAYYWWNPTTRLHAFFGPQVSYVFQDKAVHKVSFYMEANTNELYVLSYSKNENWKTLDIDDIFFLGVGAKVYFK